MEMSVSPWTVAFTLLNSVILFFLLRHFLFKPVNDMLTSRQQEVEGDINKAKEDKDLAEKYLTESESNLKGSREKGKSIVEKYKQNAESLSNDILKEANKEAREIVERAMKEAEREKQKAEAELKTYVVDLALMMSAKALESTIDEKEHRRLINDFIAKVGN